jgi:tight adherence protein B
MRWWIGAVLSAVAVLVWPARRSGLARVSTIAGVATRETGWPSTDLADPQAAVEPARWRVRLGRMRAALPGRATDGAPDRDVLVVLEGLASGLRAGLSPARALRHVADTQVSSLIAGGTDPEPLRTLLSHLLSRASAGAELEPCWREAGARWGSPAVLAVAEGWGLCERHGAPLVDVLDALVEALRDGARTAAAIETSLAAPRATAALLGVLPLGGVVLGELVGVHPLGVVVGTPVGRVVGAAGLLATFGGRVWMRRLVAAVERG